MRIVGFLALYLISISVTAQHFGQADHPMNKLTPNIDILQYWGKASNSDKEIYLAAEKILAGDPEANYGDLVEDDHFQSLCTKYNKKILGGPMLGNVTSDGISIWLRTVKPVKVEVVVTGRNFSRKYGPVNANLASDLAVAVKIDGLEEDSEYAYSILIHGEVIDLSVETAFTTAPKIDNAANTRITFGSCPHRWGLGNEQLWQQIDSRNPIAMLLLGDIAVQDRNDHFGMHRADYLARDFQPAWQQFVSYIPVYASWDDHDYFDNDKAGIPVGFSKADKEKVREVFKNSWVNPYYGLEDKNEGIFTRTRIGSVDIIMTDNRYFRESKKGSFLGNEQMQWLNEALAHCTGSFIILSCGSMWSDYVSNGKDSWGVNDPQGREEIFRLIEEQNKAVLLISGDRHGARGFTIPRKNGLSFYEFEAGSLGARVGPPATKPEWSTQLYGIDGKFAFGEFTFDTSLADPTVTFKLIEEDGEVIYDQTLKRSELLPGNYE